MTKELPQVKEVTVDGKMSKRISKTVINFKPGINIIIGPNGSGKSSLFELLLRPNKEAKEKCKIDSIAGNYFFFDFEKHNPRKESMAEKLHHVTSRLISHGESNNKIIQLIDSEEVKDKMVFMDEPEQALDVENIKKLIDILKRTKASQINIITHHPFIILEPEFNVIELKEGYYDEVISLAKSIGEKARR